MLADNIMIYVTCFADLAALDCGCGSFCDVSKLHFLANVSHPKSFTWQ